ncbi:MAG: hypothetical protein JWN03_3102 [Nocardia sp.]|nr:hypothetical protein [Nocardia sp.]
MGQDLDAIAELSEDFTTELPRANRTKSTIDTYSRDIGFGRLTPKPVTITRRYGWVSEAG